MNAQVYVSTYKKYNNGILKGAWINLKNHTKESFMGACFDLHKDERDPELMFQDYEGFPARFYSECGINETVFDEYLSLTETEKHVVDVYLNENPFNETSCETILENYLGTFENRLEWAYQHVEETIFDSSTPEIFKNYFDYESFTRDCELNGDVNFIRNEGYFFVFNNNF
jgi:antirestriction protein